MKPFPSNTSCLVLGRAGMDLYADPPGTKLTEAAVFRSSIGGSAGNIAAGLSRLGLTAALLTCVSDDAVGRFVLGQLDHYGIRAHHVVTVSGEPRTSLAVTETRIDDTQNVIYRNNAADFQLDLAHVETVPFSDFGLLIVTGTALAAEPSRSATLVAMEKAAAEGLFVVLDVDYRPYSWETAGLAAETYLKAADLCDLVVGNDEEFAVMAGPDGPGGLDLARSLAAKGTAAIYKMGEKGSVTFDGDTEFSAGIFPVEAIKPMGAGDAFMASLIGHLSAGGTLNEAVLRGSAAAAIVVSKFGCAPAMPIRTELEEFMAGTACRNSEG